jgi:maltose alpha-D-glucosyltransferase/alpha-amylase
MHLALASDASNPTFFSEPFTANYQRSMYSSLRKLVRDRFNLLESSLSKLTPEVQEFAKKVLHWRIRSWNVSVKFIRSESKE